MSDEGLPWPPAPVCPLPSMSAPRPQSAGRSYVARAAGKIDEGSASPTAAVAATLPPRTLSRASRPSTAGTGHVPTRPNSDMSGTMLSFFGNSGPTGQADISQSARRESPSSDACAATSSEEDRWRKAFSAEAMEVVQAMRVVVNSVNTSHFGTRFEEWRMVDLKATAQMQQHVKELHRLNESMDQFLAAFTNSRHVADFANCLQGLSQRADELSATRTELVAGFQSAAQEAAKQAVLSLKAEVHGVSGLIKKHMLEEKDRKTAEEGRWVSLEARLDQLQDRLEKASEDVRGHGRRIDEFGIAQRAASQQVSSALEAQLAEHWASLEARLDQLQDRVEKAGEDVQGHSRRIDEFGIAQRLTTDQVSSVLEASEAAQLTKLEKAMERLAAACRESNQCTFKEFREHVSGVLRPVGCSLEDFKEFVQQWQEGMRVAEADTQEWRLKAETLERSIAALKDEASGLRSSIGQAAQEKITQDAKVQGLEAELATTSGALKEALDCKLDSGLLRIRTLEKRGNLQVNCQTGEVSLLKPIDFLPQKAGQAGPCLKDAENTEKTVIADIAELASLLMGRMTLEVHMKTAKGSGGDKAEQLAEGRAACIRACLQDAAPDATQVPVLALPGNKGSNQNRLVVRLDKDLFESPDTVKGGKAARSRSPAGKRSG